MKPEHRAAIEGIKLSMLDKWNKGETHPPVNVLMILWLIDRIEELEQELKDNKVEWQNA